MYKVETVSSYGEIETVLKKIDSVHGRVVFATDGSHYTIIYEVPDYMEF